ncbi:hypothetical protein HIM_04013 [Hirsutella minnesotensis 3608]|uniref:Signal peptide-containing protein n=1 Tax=Hirsutella minnesotensis 3608 TaxID=1043627 RepID=A0A0F8A236_9HYPO|nr:hypothetical protein HIM_04013 [Hirsutella minnesotensis 3608]
MSFPVAVQSAVFYIVACTPCAKVRHRQKAKDQAKKERLEKAKLVTEQPGLYRHPSPFNTNPYWQDEINMGPSLPKKSASKNSSQRGLASSGRESSATPSMSEHTIMADSRTNFGDGLSTTPEDDTVSEDWNRRRGYQREDEELWGQLGMPSHRLIDAFSKARDSAGRLIDATLGIDKEVTDQERRDFYFSPRNPPVNDYHPPVVSSKPTHRDARKWMLQPPPPAKVMEGKVPVSRAISIGSKSSGKTMASEDSQLSRSMQDRLMKERLRKENDPTETELIESLFRSRRSTSHTRSKSLSLNDSDGSQENPFEKKRKSSRRRKVASHSGVDSEDDEDVPPPQSAEGTNRSVSGSTHAARRPKLETIPSIDGGGNGRSMSRKSTKRQKPRRTRTRNSPVGDDTE